MITNKSMILNHKSTTRIIDARTSTMNAIINEGFYLLDQRSKDLCFYASKIFHTVKLYKKLLSPCDDMELF